MASTLPVRAANMSGVSPEGVSGALTSTPASRSSPIIAALPLIVASRSGVAPARFSAAGSAPAASSSRAVSTSS